MQTFYLKTLILKETRKLTQIYKIINRLPTDLPHANLSKIIAQTGELYFFDYGVVVMWGLTVEEELDVLRLIKPFEEDKIGEDDIETEGKTKL